MTAQAPAGVLLEVPEDLESFNRLFQERGWGDGLPLIPPTPERVEAMLSRTGRDRHEVVASVAPGFRQATVEGIAVNAVLAGCMPDHLPVLIAAVEAVATPAFNLQALQVTTHAVTACLVINGPIAASLGINCQTNCLGQGNRANATLGRALHLVMQNIGGAVPGELDRATQGQPGKYSFCFAENEAANPWAPLRVERGFTGQESTVTVIGTGGTLSMNCHSKVASDLLRSLADGMAFAASNDYWFGGEPWIVLSPEHAVVFHAAGLTKSELKRQLWEQSKMSGSRMSAADLARTRIARAAEFPDLGPDTQLPIAQRPDDIGILVAGGPGTHSVYLPTFGDTRSVTKKIDWRSNT